MGLNAAIAVVGLAKQTGKGVAAAQPTFIHGVSGGNVAGADVSQKPVEITSGTREPIFVQRESVATGMDPKTLAFVNAVGLFLLAALGSDTASGSNPATHTFGIGADLPWMTTFAQYGGANYFAFPDSKCDKLSLSWKGNDPLELAATFLSCGLQFPTGPFTPGTDDTLAPFFVPNGGTFQLDVGGSALTATKMTGGTFDVDNGLEAFMASGSVVPSDINVKAFSPGAKLTVVPDDLAIWRTALTGSPAGTVPSQTTVYGSFLTKFLCGTAELTVKGQKVPFTCKFPDADPKGGTAEVELDSTPVKKDASTPSIEFILKNNVATY